MALAAGARLGPYEVLSLIGAGGMGEVYRARDIRLNRDVAIKILPEDFTLSPDRAARFKREAEILASLNHPNIAAIYGLEEAGTAHALVLELVDGPTLADRIAQGPISPGEVLSIARQIAEALDAAHASGVIHRDLKPSNIKLRRDGLVKLLDFGLAKTLETLGDETTGVVGPDTTRLGVILGTPAYMSPEQVAGRPVDGRSDIFAFGAVLYEMATGRRAFAGDSHLDVLSAVLHRNPPLLSEQTPGAPAALERVVSQCLNKDPAARYQTTRELKGALAAADGEPTRRGRFRLSQRLYLSAGVIGLVAVLATIAWRFWPSSPGAAPIRTTPLTTFPGREAYPSVSPDGNYVTFTWNGPKQDNFDIYVQMIGAGAPLRLTTDESVDYQPAWSPDDRWIAFIRSMPSDDRSQLSRKEVRLIAPLGGPERKLTEIRTHESYDDRIVSWCPDSSCLIVTDSPAEGIPESLYAVSLETGEKRALTRDRSAALAHTNGSVSPNGRFLLFRRLTSWTTGDLYVVPLNPGLVPARDPRRLSRGTAATWMPDSTEIVFSDQDVLWRMRVPDAAGPTRLPFVGEHAMMPVVSRPRSDGYLRLIYTTNSSDSNIWRVDVSEVGEPSRSAPVTAISSTQVDQNAAFSPNGLRVAFASSRSGMREIWIADPDGSNAVQLTSMGAPITGSPHWSPDAQSIVFNANPEGHYQVYVVPSAGGKPRNVTADAFNDESPSFSRDGRWIYFASNRSGMYQLYRIPVVGGSAIQLTRNGGFTGFESVDGAYVYYTDTTGPVPSALWRLPVSGGQPVRVLTGVIRRAFVVVAPGVYYLDLPPGAQLSSGKARLNFFNFNTGTSRIVAQNLGNVLNGLSATPDGRTVLYSRVDYQTDLALVENFR